jgi:uncharacterized RDD family membrane protein YckC
MPEEPSQSDYVGEVIEPAHAERVSTAAGGEQWKLVCPCHKRILSPLQTPYPTGRCPKCGRRLRLPGYKGKGASQPAPAAPPKSEVPAETAQPAGTPPPAAAPVPAAPSAPAPVPAASPANAPPTAGPAPAGPSPDDEIGTIVMEPYAEEAAKSLPERAPEPQAVNVGRAAALRTADLLRQHKVLGTHSPSPGLISAWPLAGRLPRVLAGFMDLTFSLVAAGAVVALGSLGLLPARSLHPAVILTAFLTAQLLNDCLLQFRGGSLGKRLVVLTLRTRAGEAPDLGRTVLRGLLKSLLFPGWILALVHPSQCALHDLVCGTLVLKGRPR